MTTGKKANQRGYHSFTEFPYNNSGAGPGHGTLFIRRYGVKPNIGSIQFPAFITNFQETFNSAWERETVFGRSDPMQFYGGTQRVINLQFKLVAGSVEIARQQLNLLDTFMKYLYPNYQNNAYSAAPLIGVKYENLIKEGENFLVGTVGTFSFTPNFEEGVFSPRSFPQSQLASALAPPPYPSADALEIYPKIIDLSFDFYPLHRQTLGWRGSKFLGEDFHPIEMTDAELNNVVAAAELQFNKNLEAKKAELDINSDELELKNIDAELAKEIEKQKKDEAPGKPKSNMVDNVSLALQAGITETQSEIDALKAKTLEKGQSSPDDIKQMKQLEKTLLMKKKALAGL
tara:strand:+ start:463 stop:1497 length:1035 start_codon:yes stop_codon:yes gene_type:complete